MEDGNGQDNVAHGHDNQAVDDGALVVLRAVGDDTADKAQDVDAGVEERVYERACLAGEAEFRAEEQNEDGVHDVIAETLAHVAQCRRNQAFGLILEHVFTFLVYFAVKLPKILRKNRPFGPFLCKNNARRPFMAAADGMAV